MKTQFFISVFLVAVCCSFLCARTPDSLWRKNQFFIVTYPQSFYKGHMSVGLEHNFKRFRQELMCSYKVFNSLETYNYDKAYRVSYFLKYNFIARKNHLISADLAYINLQESYKNKIDPYIHYLSMSDDPQNNPKPLYRADRSLKISGLGIGASNLSRLYKNFFLGINLTIYRVHYQFEYTAKEHISGPEVQSYIMSSQGTVMSSPLSLPYTVKEESGAKLYPNVLVKLAYRL